MAFVHRSNRFKYCNGDESKFYIEPHQFESRPSKYSFNSTFSRNKVKCHQPSEQEREKNEYYEMQEERRKLLYEEVKEKKCPKKDKLGKGERFEKIGQSHLGPDTYDIDSQQIIPNNVFDRQAIKMTNKRRKWTKSLPTIPPHVKTVQVGPHKNNACKVHYQRMANRGASQWKRQLEKTVSLVTFEKPLLGPGMYDLQKDDLYNRVAKKNRLKNKARPVRKLFKLNTVNKENAPLVPQEDNDQ